MKVNNILITGGAGFIGSNLALSLVREGYNITVLDNLSLQVHSENSLLFQSIKDKVNFIQGDIRHRKDWLVALKDQDVVVHLAAETGTGQSMYEIERYIDVNITGTALMLDLLANTRHSIKKMIVASSRSIYGEGKYHCVTCGTVYPTARQDEHMAAGDFTVKCPFCRVEIQSVATDETSKIHPTSIYGITKQTQEQMVLTIGKSLAIPTVALRYQNVYGPGQSLSNPYTGILSIFSTRIKNRNEIIIFEDGNEGRDFVYIDDVITATTLAIEHPEANYEAFNVGSGVLTTVSSVAQALVDLYDISVPLKISNTYRLGDIRNNYADLNKIFKHIGFLPTISFQEGIQRFVTWVNSQKIQKDYFEKSILESRERGIYR